MAATRPKFSSNVRAEFVMPIKIFFFKNLTTSPPFSSIVNPRHNKHHINIYPLPPCWFKKIFHFERFTTPNYGKPCFSLKNLFEVVRRGVWNSFQQKFSVRRLTIMAWSVCGFWNFQNPKTNRFTNANLRQTTEIRVLSLRNLFETVRRGSRIHFSKNVLWGDWPPWHGVSLGFKIF